MPHNRIRIVQSMDPRPDREFVLYWMIANRRPHRNFSLDRAVAWAHELGKPLVILEALRCDYPFASDRLHTFVLEGMRDNFKSFSETPALYFPYLETEVGRGKGLLKALASHACAVVTDDFPGFFLPKMIEAGADQIDVRMDAVDSNGLLSMRMTSKTYPTAHAFRRHMQKSVAEALQEFPRIDSFSGRDIPTLHRQPKAIVKRWTPLCQEQLQNVGALVKSCPIDHDIPPGYLEGGHESAASTLEEFVRKNLGVYNVERNSPEQSVTSGLSPFLHFGHISAHEVFEKIVVRENWSPESLEGASCRGARAGFWRMSEESEAFLDQLVTWRELGYNFCATREDYDRYESLPEWARSTLAFHESDPRANIYSLSQLENSETHDELWNAAQRQLVFEGRIHNYLRMLWGKKILKWSQTPRAALDAMIHLNNKYALDGRDPNSYSGIFWVLGRYDRPWGPERPIFGKVRYMTSSNTARKVRVGDYIERWRNP